MKHAPRTAAWAALLAIALGAGVARADWNPGFAYKMHFPQRPDLAGYDVNFTSPRIVADDWKCSETGPVKDIHFWFSAQGDWLNLQIPLDGQIQNIHVSIHEDVPAAPGNLFSHPGRLLWSRDFNVAQVKIRQNGAGPQSWYDPATGQLIPNDHQKVYQCNITKITEPFYQKRGHVYWLDVSMAAQAPLGWKSSDQNLYPAPYTGNHYQDDAAWQPASTAAWTDIHYPNGPKQGQSMDMAFVVSGFRQVFHHKMHFPQYPDPTGADVNFSFPRGAADDWQCSETGPVEDIHFWFSAISDWFNLQNPLNQQIFNIHVTINDDIPTGPASPFSKPGNVLWSRDYSVLDPAIKISQCFTEGQAWYDPSLGYVPDNHRMLYQMDIDPIDGPFIQQQGTIYWLTVSIQSEQLLGWKTADVDIYPQPYTGAHFLDDGVWATTIIPPGPPIPWQELIWPAVAPHAGESIDLAFVITRKPDPTGVGGTPKSFHLEQNYPNPFNPQTTIRYTLPERSDVQLAVFGVDGKLVRVLESGSKPVGTFEATWDGRDASGRAVASGVYFYRLKAGSFVETKKMVLMK